MSKKYWLKGGLIGVVLYILGVIAYSLRASGFQPGWFLYVFLLVAVRPLTTIKLFFDTPDAINSMGMWFVVVGIILLICFGIGAFLGWIYQKNKKVFRIMMGLIIVITSIIIMANVTYYDRVSGYDRTHGIGVCEGKCAYKKTWVHDFLNLIDPRFRNYVKYVK